MRDTLVLTVIGSDRPGLVEALAERIAAAGGNWEASHMARLGGQFAGILQVALDGERVDALVAALRGLDAAGLQVTARPGSAAALAEPTGARVRLELTGDDRPGIVHDVSRILAERGVNVDELFSEVASAPMSGEPLFRARATLRVPAAIALPELRARLEALAGELMVDLAIDDERP